MTQPRAFPFDVLVTDLIPDDLAALNQVYEGWYVEYKEMPIGRAEIAKSLSAFANQYGGWFFLGVAENRTTHTADRFPGIPTSSVPDALESIRNATKDLLHPSVFYDYKVIDGPVDLIDLPNGQSVIAIQIPQGPATPYVHNNGRIYRRIGDSSDPVHITDRAEVDLLSQRRQAMVAQLEGRVRRSPRISDLEKRLTYVHLHILSDPYEILGHRYDSDLQVFSEIMKGDLLPFDNTFHSHEGFVARQGGSNIGGMRSLTWEFSRHCHSLISIPLNVYNVVSLRREHPDSPTIQDFSAAIANSRIDPANIVDLTYLLRAVRAISVRHRHLVGEAGIRGPFYVKCRLENIWRTIPYLETPAFIQQVNRFGLPLVQDSSLVVPEGRALDDFVFWEEYDLPTNEDEIAWVSPIFGQDTGDIAARILPAFGLPLESALFDGNRLRPAPTQ